MFNLFKKVAPNSLEAALKACHVANKQGYSEALVYLDELHDSISQATEIISDCIDGMKRFHINDASLINNIQTQLQTVQTEFENSYYDTQRNLNIKRKMSDKFNITLFGKTKAGKVRLWKF
jgi:hypothetical protein